MAKLRLGTFQLVKEIALLKTHTPGKNPVATLLATIIVCLHSTALLLNEGWVASNQLVLDTNPQFIIHFGTIRTHPRLFFFSFLHTLPPNKPWPLEHSQPVPTAPRSNGLRSAVQLYPLFTVSLAIHTLTKCQGIHSMEHANQRFDELPHNPANPAQSQSGYLTSYMTLLPQYLR
ncbi:hypothetical protein K449DRAFT_441171 [Hypoxylon sp. EC38]|nr:hypothetical protein K449DRAFT_441171 [Hypoxylon sp. EC38]